VELVAVAVVLVVVFVVVVVVVVGAAGLEKLPVIVGIEEVVWLVLNLAVSDVGLADTVVLVEGDMVDLTHEGTVVVEGDRMAVVLGAPGIVAFGVFEDY